MTAPALLAAAAAACAVYGTAALLTRTPRSREPRRGRASVRAAAAVGRFVGPPAAPRTLRAWIAAAGLPASVTTTDVMAVKAGAAALAALVMLLGEIGSMRLTLVVTVTAAGAAFFAPDVWLRRRAWARVDRAALELPAALDLIGVALAAGLPLPRALKEVGQQGTGVVAGELRAVADRVALGQAPAAAITVLQERLPSRHIAVLAAAIDRAERHGAPLGPTLDALAAEVRNGRAVALQERAARTVPRMQLVIALVLVPAVLALVAAVVLARVL